MLPIFVTLKFLSDSNSAGLEVTRKKNIQVLADPRDVVLSNVKLQQSISFFFIKNRISEIGLAFVEFCAYNTFGDLF